MSNNVNTGPTSTFYMEFTVNQPSNTPMTISVSTLTGNSLRFKMASSLATSSSPVTINEAMNCPNAASSVVCGTQRSSGAHSYVYLAAPTSQTTHKVVVYPSSSHTASTHNEGVYTIVAVREIDAYPTQLLSSATMFDVPPPESATLQSMYMYSYYQLFVPPSSNSFTLTIRPLSTSSNPALYINRDSFYLGENAPTGTDATWHSDRPGHQRETISVDVSDANFIHGGGTYYITVANPVSASPQPFTVSPITETGNPIFLQSGVPQHDTLSASSYRYYQYYMGAGVDADKSVVIDVTPEYGDPNVYVGCQFKAGSPDDQNDGFPSMLPGHFNGSSTLPFEDSIIVRSSLDDSPPATDGNSIEQDCPIIYIAVYSFLIPSNGGQARSTEYSITAVPSGGVTSINPGTSYEGTVFRNTYNFYTIEIGSESIR